MQYFPTCFLFWIHAYNSHSKLIGLCYHLCISRYNSSFPNKNKIFGFWKLKKKNKWKHESVSEPTSSIPLELLLPSPAWGPVSNSLRVGRWPTRWNRSFAPLSCFQSQSSITAAEMKLSMFKPSPIITWTPLCLHRRFLFSPWTASEQRFPFQFMFWSVLCQGA